jgi:hypothetical protein
MEGRIPDRLEELNRGGWVYFPSRVESVPTDVLCHSNGINRAEVGGQGGDSMTSLFTVAPEKYGRVAGPFSYPEKGSEVS